MTALELPFDIMVAEETVAWVLLLVLLTLHFLDKFLSHEGIMNFCLLLLQIETHRNSRYSCIYLLNITNDTEFVSIKTNSLHTLLQFFLRMLTSPQRQGIQRMSLISLLHNKWKRQDIRLLLVDLIVSARLIIKLNAFSTITGNQDIHFRHWTKDSILPQVFIHVQLPLLGWPELLIFHQLEVISLNIAINSENVKSVLEIHRESLLLEWEANVDFFARTSNQFL